MAETARRAIALDGVPATPEPEPRPERRVVRARPQAQAAPAVPLVMPLVHALATVVVSVLDADGETLATGAAQVEARDSGPHAGMYVTTEWKVFPVTRAGLPASVVYDVAPALGRPASRHQVTLRYAWHLEAGETFSLSRDVEVGRWTT